MTCAILADPNRRSTVRDLHGLGRGLVRARRRSQEQESPGKVAVISGMGSGFAKATAGLFANKGRGLIMFDLNQAGLDATAKECRCVTHSRECAREFQEIRRQEGRLTEEHA